MSKRTETQSKAARFSWEEILRGRGFQAVDTEVVAGGERLVTWQFDDGHEFARVMTVGEEDQGFADNGSFDTSGSLTKFDAIRVLWADGDLAVATDLVATAGSLLSGPLVDIGRTLSARDRQRESGLSSAERAKLNPAFAAMVDKRRREMEARDEATRQMKAAALGAFGPPSDGVALDDFLLEPDVEPNYLIEGLWPYGGNIIIIAPAKTGKTTMSANLMRSLADEVPFLDRFDPCRLDGDIGYLNYELTDKQARTWLGRSGIKNSERVRVWNLRGQPNPFRSRESMAEFATDVVGPLGIEVMLIDPFSSAFAGESSLDNDEVKAFLLMLDEFKLLSGVKHLAMAVHAGNDTRKPRGATTLQDHPDALWFIDKDPSGTRYFRAYGRDVEIEEGALSFDPATSSLSFGGASRRAVTNSRLEDATYKAIQGNEGCTGSYLDEEVRGNKSQKATARKALVTAGRVRIELGPNNSRRHFTVGSPASPSSP